MQSNFHKSVLLDESIDGLSILPTGIYIDATLGRAGHSKEILKKLTTGKLIAIDRDPDAIMQAEKSLSDPRLILIHGKFSELDKYVNELNLNGKINGIIMDLGVSSPQLDNKERGFSFMNNGPLDMRMDNSKGITAADWINKAEISEMIRVFKEYGEEKFSAHIARCIVADRDKKPFLTTKDLADFIVKVSKTKEKHKHPATRIFQAIRIHINKELEEIERGLNASLEVLAPNGKLVVISFHSLEDRIVKNFMRNFSQAQQIPDRLPILEEELNKNKKLKLCGKAIKPTEQEIEINPRSRSSILRIAQRLG